LVSEKNAGYEAPDIFRQNHRVIRDLGLSILASRTVNEAVRRLLSDPDDPPRGKLSWWLSNTIERVALRCLGRRAEPLELVPWERFEGVVEAHRAVLVEMSRRFQVVKDPAFCWTLGVWAASGAQIDHVLVCVRNFDAMLESHFAAGNLLFRSRSTAKNSFIYGLGLCMMAIHDHRLPHSVVRFPDFLDDPATLYEAVRFPAPVSYDRFLVALSKTASSELIHDRR